MTAQTALLDARGLQVRQGGRTVLDVPSLSLAAGETMALVGPNGAGKSTLLLALAAIDRPAAGELFFRGQRITPGPASAAYRRCLAMVFQEPLLFRATVAQNVASGLRWRGLGKAETAGRVRESLERFRITHLHDRSAGTLSGGEAQRASLARAMATNPELLLLDEPFASLDPPTRDAIIDDLEAALKIGGASCLFATHDRTEALRLADRLAVMNGGRIIQEGTPQEVINRPQDEFVASFVGVDTILPARVISSGGGSFLAEAAGAIIEAGGEFPRRALVLLCIRPENVTLSLAAPPGRTSARNSFWGRIVRLSPLGPFQKAQLDCGFPLSALITQHSVAELGLEPGVQVLASIKATSIHVIRCHE